MITLAEITRQGIHEQIDRIINTITTNSTGPGQRAANYAEVTAMLVSELAAALDFNDTAVDMTITKCLAYAPVRVN